MRSPGFLPDLDSQYSKSKLGDTGSYFEKVEASLTSARVALNHREAALKEHIDQSFNAELVPDRDILGAGPIARLHCANGSFAALKCVFSDHLGLLEEEANILQLEAGQETGVLVQLFFTPHDF
ncbi:hypothetical protein HDU96_006980 [Phlyctochytrium bullatum]|nr:hypothetical protein HDU96_006980 [Phlyctochytrium bullatum]